MPSPTPAPPGYTALSDGNEVLLVRADRLDGWRREGLHELRRWENLLAGSPARAGRGATTRVQIAGDTAVILKKMRRGGLASAFWRDRFPGTRRLLANLTVPEDAVSRGKTFEFPVSWGMDLQSEHERFLTEEVVGAPVAVMNSSANDAAGWSGEP